MSRLSASQNSVACVIGKVNARLHRFWCIYDGAQQCEHFNCDDCRSYWKLVVSLHRENRNMYLDCKWLQTGPIWRWLYATIDSRCNVLLKGAPIQIARNFHVHRFWHQLWRFLHIVEGWVLVEASMRTEGAREVKFGPRKMERCQVNPAFAILGCLKF